MSIENPTRQKPALITFLYGAFQRPFHGLAFLVWLFFVGGFLFHAQAPLLQGRFWDSDDYTHFVRVIDWMEGQSWFDPVLYRLAPPAGVALHFSRLSELPLALVMAPLHAAGVSWMVAAFIAAGLVPMALFGCFLAALVWAARAVMDQAWARLSVFPALFAPAVTFQFSMGRVDHHGLSIILTLLALGCALRFAQAPAQVKWAAAAGAFLALGQCIALETLPWLLLCAVWIGAWVVFGGRRWAQGGIVFGLSLYVCSALLLALTVRPENYGQMEALAFSYLYVFLAGLIALVFVMTGGLALWLETRALRVCVSVALAAAVGAWFLIRFPSLMAGPFGALDPAFANVFLPNIAETVPLLSRLSGGGQLLACLLLPLAGVGASLFLMVKARDEKIWVWLLFFFLGGAATILALSYESRVMFFAQLFAILPVSVLLAQGWQASRKIAQTRLRKMARLALVLLLGPVAGLTGLASEKDSAVLLYPLQMPAKPEANTIGLWQILNSAGSYGDRPRIILAGLDDGARILFYTKHKVLAAPYHTNAKGNLAVISFFTTVSDDAARAFAHQAHADLIVLRRDLDSLYKNRKNEQDQTAEGLAEQLVSGKEPDWLRPVDMAFMPSYLLFEVRPPKAGASQP